MRTIVLIVSLFGPSLASGAGIGTPLIFSVDFQDVIDGTGTGFDDPQLGAARRSQLITNTNTIGAFFRYPDRTVVLNVRTSEFDGTGDPAVGATCRAVATLPGSGGFFGPRSLAVAQVGAAPICPDGGHINLLVDFGFTYDYDPSDGTVGWDFDTVMKHEIVHGLGYGSDGRLAGETPYGASTLNAFRSTSHTSMSEFFAFDAAGDMRVWDSSGNYLGDPGVALSDGQVFFNGGGVSFPLVADDDGFFLHSGVSTDLMAPLEEGVVRSDFSVNDRTALDAIGWGVVFVVPEPSSCIPFFLSCLWLLVVFVRSR